ncbi:hypothetical protein J6590_028390 [Homalodisca vitripennis]|nr:hypothetical protein J6590_028390 [Homalodisca vitripennis]
MLAGFPDSCSTKVYEVVPIVPAYEPRACGAREQFNSLCRNWRSRQMCCWNSYTLALAPQTLHYQSDEVVPIVPTYEPRVCGDREQLNSLCRNWRSRQMLCSTKVYEVVPIVPAYEPRVCGAREQFNSLCRNWRSRQMCCWNSYTLALAPQLGRPH